MWVDRCKGKILGTYVGEKVISRVVVGIEVTG